MSNDIAGGLFAELEKEGAETPPPTRPPSGGCPACGSGRETLREKEQHLGAYCADCGKWLRWDSRPLTIERVLDFVLPFGKHKGTAFRDVPTDYVRWMCANVADAKLSEMARMALESRGEPTR